MPRRREVPKREILPDPKFGNVDILFLGEYLDDNPKTVIEEALKVGYDVVLIDSFAEVQEAIKETNRMTTSGSEKFLIDMMIRHNLAGNDSKTHKIGRAHV